MTKRQRGLIEENGGKDVTRPCYTPDEASGFAHQMFLEILNSLV